MYGWHFDNVVAAVTAAIKSTYYSGRTRVEFRLSNAKVHVRPDNLLARTLSNKWLRFLLWLLLLFPLIWLYRRFGARGGGRWEVCGGAYALKTWEAVGREGEDGADGQTVQTAQGRARLVGVREGEWFQRWEGTIRRAVVGRLQAAAPLAEPDSAPGSMLDGYPHGQPNAMLNLRMPLFPPAGPGSP